MCLRAAPVSSVRSSRVRRMDDKRVAGEMVIEVIEKMNGALMRTEALALRRGPDRTSPWLAAERGTSFMDALLRQPHILLGHCPSSEVRHVRTGLYGRYAPPSCLVRSGGHIGQDGVPGRGPGGLMAETDVAAGFNHAWCKGG